MQGSCGTLYCLEALMSLPSTAGAKRRTPKAKPTHQRAAAIAGMRSGSKILLFEQGKHNVAIPEVAREVLALSWQVVQGSSTHEEQHLEDHSIRR